MLKACYDANLPEAGCDEAGRGCLAGPVFAAAVILPKGFRNSLLNDSKQLTAKQRSELRPLIEREAVAWAVASASPAEIDEVNILNASITAMHRAVALLGPPPQLLLIDGNRFHPYPGIGHRCFVRGDSIYLAIAAASVLAKTYRDDYMESLDVGFPGYGWRNNKGYPTAEHRRAVLELGPTIHHRASFHFSEQLTFAFD